MKSCKQKNRRCCMILTIYTVGFISNSLFTFLLYYPDFQKSNVYSSYDVESHSKVRILCWIMTTPNNHKTKATAVRDTWAKRCNITLFMSTREDKSIPTIALPVKEGRADLWAKTKAAFLYIHAHYKSDADWFIKTDDDTYIIMENLRYFLHNQSLEIPAYHGRRLKPWVNQGFMSGGAGYVINSKALELLVTKGFTNRSMCNPHVSKDEDVELGKCFDNLNVKAGDSRDGLGRERFLSYTMEQHMVPGVIPAAYKAFFYYNEKEGKDCCSDYAVSFHYIPPHMMVVLEYLIYQLKVNPFPEDDTRT